MPTPHHPCGNVPVSFAQVTAYYCHHHQAWCVDVQAWTEVGDEAEGGYSRHSEFGPFDTQEDVARWVELRLAALLEMARRWPEPVGARPPHEARPPSS